MYSFFAASPKGFEYALMGELAELGATEIKESVGGVYFSATLEQAYNVTLWSRLASRIVIILYQGECRTAEQLYDAAFCLDWPSHFDCKCSFAVDFHGTGGFIKNTQFGALKIKDAIVDRFRDEFDRRPNVSRSDADIRIDAHYRRNQITIGLNFSGSALHQRGYRSRAGEAPLKENLAANMLIRSGWSQSKLPLFDPFCGSGTILIEAALMAADIAPNIHRQHYGFECWSHHNVSLWQACITAANQRADIGLANCQVKLVGSDIDSHMVALAKRNAQLAGVAHLIEFNVANVLSVEPIAEQGMIVSNPPYGERLGNMTALLKLYYQLGEKLKAEFGNWQLALLCSDTELLSALKLKADKQMNMFNGPLACAFNLYSLHSRESAAKNNSSETLLGDLSQETTAMGNIAEPFVNRVKKNIKQLDKWARKEGIDCYRIYDADLPEYNVAIDRYQDYLVVQEYAAPSQIPEQVTRRRITDILLTLPETAGVKPEHLVFKTRERQKGDSQYQKLNKQQLELVVNEYGAKFRVNLTDYLDTGLFLDHRLTRKLLGEKAKDKRVLNLFAYTGSASVHAAKGGAITVTTVDMSNTYLNWAKDNFILNGLMGRQYQFIQADCLQWLTDCEQTFDLIFIDPPTFSNSKRMNDSWDVQRDHISMLSQVKACLAENGEIIFSNNKRKFKMDFDGLAELGLVAENLDGKLLPQDFRRNPQIHNVWRICYA